MQEKKKVPWNGQTIAFPHCPYNLLQACFCSLSSWYNLFYIRYILLISFALGIFPCYCTCHRQQGLQFGELCFAGVRIQEWLWILFCIRMGNSTSEITVVLLEALNLAWTLFFCCLFQFLLSVLYLFLLCLDKITSVQLPGSGGGFLNTIMQEKKNIVKSVKFFAIFLVILVLHLARCVKIWSGLLPPSQNAGKCCRKIKIISSVYEPSASTYTSHYPQLAKMHIFSWQLSFEAPTEPLSWYLHSEVFRNQLMSLS